MDGNEEWLIASGSAEKSYSHASPTIEALLEEVGDDE